MKGKQLALVLVLLVAVGGVALYLNSQSTAVWKETATTSSGKILDFPLNDVSQVTIKEGGNELNLVKKDDVWTVKERADFPADFQKTGALIRKIWELKPVQDVKIGPSQLARLQLIEPGAGTNNGTLIDLKGTGEKRIAALLLGKKHLRNQDESAEGASFPVGRYVMAQDSSNRVYLVSDTFDDVQLKPEQWLGHDFIKVENTKSIAVAGTTPAVNWKIIRDNASAPWKFADSKPGEELDNSKAAGVSSIYTYLGFTDVMPADAPVSDTGLDKPSTVHLETFDNLSYDLKIGKLNGENYPVLVSIKGDLPKERTPGADEKPEDKTKLDQEFETKQKSLSEKLAKEQKLPPRPFLIAKTTVEQMLKERSALVAEKKTPSPTPGGMSSPAAKSIPAPPHPIPTPAKPK